MRTSLGHDPSATPRSGPVRHGIIGWMLDRRRSRGEPGRVGWGFILLYTLAYAGAALMLLAPLLVSLAL